MDGAYYMQVRCQLEVRMEILSKPAMVDEIVTDLDVAFNGGDLHFTLRPGDTFEPATPELCILTLHNPPEVIRLFRSQMLWYRTRERTMSRPVTPSVGTKSAPGSKTP